MPAKLAMIARHWRGLAKRECAEAYVEHLHSETFPQLVQLPGFHDASILRRESTQGVEFLVVTVWKSLDAIRGFAGNDAESAVVPEKVQRMMIEFDRRARHYEVVD
jgi:heme-degrading monooxygenase HmoA